MCGIAGYIGFEKLSQTKICRTKDLLINRGPDSQMSLSFSVGETNYEFIHSRLSIIDINTRSDQPFIKNNCIIIFNGEIYNYLELRKKLESKGVTFITNSDTEVLLESYALYGPDCVRNFEGMWSFALFDKRKDKYYYSDAFAKKIVDKVGAGDTMLSIIGPCIKSNIDHDITLLISSLAAAQSVETIGNKYI